MEDKKNIKQNLEIIFEYFIIIFPIALYVAVESMHIGAYYLLNSPEWAIASIFLVFQATFIFYKNVISSGRKVKPYFLGLLILIFLLVTCISLFNAYFSIDHEKNTLGKIWTRWSILLFSSIYFYTIIKSSKI